MTKASPAAAKKATRTKRDPQLRTEEIKPAAEPKPIESQLPVETKVAETRPSIKTTPPAEAKAPAEIKPPIIQVLNLEKTYHTARGTLTLFKGLNLEIETGAMVAIVGQSGAGKSTLLHILGALDAPSAGTVYCASTDVAKLSTREAAAFRNREIGYVWQFHYLLPEFSALENVAMPLLARGYKGNGAPGDRSWSLGSWKREALTIAANWLREVGLEDRGSHRPGELSGGEQQRVALARALVNNPRVLLADEPTGDLDELTAGRVFDLIERLHASHGLTSILVTHNLDLAARCTRALRLENGRLSPLAATPNAVLPAGL